MGLAKDGAAARGAFFPRVAENLPAARNTSREIREQSREFRGS
jgi:hypothetical protein